MFEITAVKAPTNLTSLAGLLINPVAQRVGHETKKHYITERDASLQLLKGKTEWLWLAERYAKSYISSKPPTVGHYGDHLLSNLIAAVIYDCQHQPGGQTLTRHASRVWEKFTHQVIHPYLLDNEIPTLYGWGPLGTLAFYTYYLPDRERYSQDNWLELVNSLLTLFWAAQGQKFELGANPNSQLLTLLAYAGLDDDYFKLMQQLNAVTFDTPNYRARRYGHQNDPYRFKQKFLLGESFYSLHPYLDLVLQQRYSKGIDNLLSIAKPCGMQIVLQAVVVQSLLALSDFFINLSPEVKLQPLTTFIKTLGLEEQQRLMNHWLAVEDARHFQNIFNAFYQPQSNADLRLWLLCSNDGIDTSLANPWRLTSLN